MWSAAATFTIMTKIQFFHQTLFDPDRENPSETPELPSKSHIMWIFFTKIL